MDDPQATSTPPQRRPSQDSLLTGQHIHDLLRALTAVDVSISGFRAIAPDAPSDGELSDLVVALAEAARITAELRIETASQGLERQPLDVNEFVKHGAAALERQLGMSVILRVRLAPMRVHVLAHPAELEYILTNLVTNAGEAVEDRGSVTVEVGTLYLADTRAGESSATPQPYVRLSVADSGKGIAPDAILRVFEPFFSTKPGHSGVGLTQVAAIARTLKGWMLVESEPDAGSRIHVFLPAAPLGSESGG